MADLITRLKVDSSEYDSKIKRAAEQINSMERSVRSAGDSFAQASKAEVDYIRSLGEMGTRATTAKGKLRELTNSIADITTVYKGMTDTEKNSDFGRAMADSINRLKQRAGELRDQMDDLNEEIKHIASDTQFSDGMRLMTSTIGSCASAVVAWSGDGKKMEEVIKDLAKIQTTVAAVEALTKAFQKQNLVLLKNPYVAVAAAIAAVGVAIYEVVKHTSELDHVTKALNDVQARGRENAAQEVMRISSLNDILRDNTRTMDERRDALTAIQNLVPDYHGALDEEGTLINDNSDALDDYINNLQRAATAQAAFDRMVELQKQKLNKQLELQEKTVEYNRMVADRKEAAASNTLIGTSSAGVTAASSYSATAGVRELQAKSDMNAARDELDAINKEINALQELVDVNAVAGKAADERTTTTKTATKTEREVLDIIQQRAKRIADVEAAMDLLRNALATTEDENLRAWGMQELEKYQAQLDALNGIIKEMPAEVEKIPTAMERAAEALTNAKSAYLRGETGKDAYADANAAMNLQGLVDKNALEGINIPIGVEVTDEEWQSLVDAINEQLAALDLPPIELDVKTGNVNGVNEVANDANLVAGNFQKAASAVSNLSGAIGQMEDPAAKIAGIIGQAVASIALTFATSLKGAVGPWDWIAASIAGVSTMISTIAAIKSATAEYHADGGIVGSVFQPMGTDVVPAMLTPGEEVLTANDPRHRNNISAMGDRFGSLTLRTEISGESLAVVLDNNNRRRGRGKTVR